MDASLTETVVDDGLPTLAESCFVEKQGDVHLSQVLEIYRSKDVIILEVVTEEKHPKAVMYGGGTLHITAKDCNTPTCLRVTGLPKWSVASAEISRYTLQVTATRDLSFAEIQRKPCLFFGNNE